METSSKSIFKDQAFWLYAATFILSFLGYLEGQDFIKANPTAVTLVGMIAAALGVYVRMKTKDSVHIVGK